FSCVENKAFAGQISERSTFVTFESVPLRQDCNERFAEEHFAGKSSAEWGGNAARKTNIDRSINQRFWLMCRIKILKRKRDARLALSEFPYQLWEKWSSSRTAKSDIESATTTLGRLLQHLHGPICSIKDILGFAKKGRTLCRQG